MSSQNSNWKNIRGKKLSNTKPDRVIDSKLINNRILIITKTEMDKIKQSYISVPNEFARWIIN